MPVFNNILAGAAGQSSGSGDGYIIQRSLRFDPQAGAYLNRTSTGGNRKTWTWSAWVKRSNYLTTQILFIGKGSSANPHNGVWLEGDRLVLQSYPNNFVVVPSKLLRDTSAWYHFVVAFDTTIASPASDRIKIWINGELQDQFHSTPSYPSQDFEGLINDNGQNIHIGQWDSSYNRFFDGYMADVHFIDGQALDETSFGEFNSDTGVWNPIAFTGSHNVGNGVNGFYLDFSDPSNVGADQSGSNNFTANNFVGQVGGADQTSVANATGALPIYSTTDTYGKTIASGPTLRSDSLAQYLQWCVPFSQGSSGQLNDLSPTGRTSAARNINGGPGSHSTAHNIFYGGSNYFSGGTSGSFSTDVWDSISSSSSEFTIEFWVKLTTASQTAGYGCTIFSSRSAGNNGAGWIDIGFQGITGNLAMLRLQISQGWDFKFNYDGSNTDAPFPVNEWTHVAVSRDSNNKVRLFGNGTLINTQTSTVGITSNSRGLIGGFAYGAYQSNVDFYLTDVRIYTTAKYTASFAPPYPISLPATSPELDLLLDTPTNKTTDAGDVIGNFATWNANDHRSHTNGPTYTYSNGGLTCDMVGGSANSSTARGLCVSTIQLPTSGKWFAEFDTSNLSNDDFALGIAHHLVQGYYNTSPNGVTGAYLLRQNGALYHPAGQLGGESSRKYYTGDIVGVLVNFDLSTPRIVWYRNGVIVGDNTFSREIDLTQGPFSFVAGTDAGGNNAYQVHANFGQRPWKYPINYSRLVIGGISTNATYNHTKLFDGDLTTYASHASFNTHYTWYGNLTDVTSLRVYLQTGSRAEVLKVKGNLNTVNHTIPANTSAGWVTINLANTGTSVEEISFYRGAGGEYQDVFAIEVNGTVLTDSNADTGYKELCTENLEDPLIKKGTDYVAATTYTGNSGTKAISSLGFSPSFVWIKSRDTNGSAHFLSDVIRGGTKVVQSNSNTTEGTRANHIQSFDSNGFTLGADGTSNLNNDPLVAWTWKGASSNTSVTAGSQNSTSYLSNAVYSNDLTSSSGGVSQPEQAFDGNVSTRATNTISADVYRTLTWAPSTAINFSSKFEVYCDQGSNVPTATWNGISVNPGSGQWVTIVNGSGTINSSTPLVISTQSAAQWATLKGVRLDGRILVDSNLTPPNLPSIDSTYNANQDSGFSICTWTGTANAVIKHGLSKAPEFILTKSRNNAVSWRIWHKDFDDTKEHYLGFDSATRGDFNANYWADIDSTYFGFPNGTYDNNKGDMVGFLFHSVPGFSHFGTYDGNSNTHGPFVPLSFQPAIVILKIIEGTAGHWKIYDNARNPANPVDKQLYPSADYDEPADDYRLDFMSNGFKIRTSGSEDNYAANSFIYGAWAKSPYKFSRAR